MLDKRAFKILNIIIGMTPEGESAVIEKNEILAQLGEEIDLLDLDNIVEMLALNDMISISFTDENCYFITPRPKGRIAYEKSQNALKAQQQQLTTAASDIVEYADFNVPEVINMRKLVIICGGSSFIGGLLAALVAFLVARFC